MLEPLGQSQVLAYLKILSLDYKIHLISFEKSLDWQNKIAREEIIKEIVKYDVDWYPLRYHKWPSSIATLWDVIRGAFLGLWLVLYFRLRIAHARSYVPSVIVLLIKWITGVKYLFDMRGFWADEKVDGGSWSSQGLNYFIAKKFEKLFLLNADEVVSLTNAGVEEIRKFPYLQGRIPSITVIPTCADLVKFTRLNQSLKKDKCNRFVLGYVGSVGTFYMFEEVAKCFVELQKLIPTALLLIINRDQHDYINKCLAIAGVKNESFQLISSSHSGVPSKIQMMDAGVFFIKPSYSKRASAPTKLAELLGCGVPCLCNVGIGDVAEIINEYNVGVAINEFDPLSIKLGIEELLYLINEPDIQERCIDAAKKHFSINEGVKRYKLIYERMTN